MSDTVIKVQDIGKRYLISHQAPERYMALRDVIANKVKELSGYVLPSTKGTKTDHPKEEFWALKNVSFEVKSGEVLGIIGRNGAGKTTLLKILSRITEPDTGRFSVRGRMASLLEVGTGFHPELTGRENIFLNGAILGMSRSEIKKKFDEIVTFSEIEKFLDTPVKRYSSGMFVRLAFSIAAHLEPEILLIDEILAVGDLAFQKKCIGKIGDVAKLGQTVLLVSHNMQTINSLSHSALYLHCGKLIDYGKSNEVIQNYLRTFSSHDSEGNIPESNRVTKSDYLVITKVLFFNSKGENSKALFFRESFNLKIIFQVNKKIDLVRLGFAICAPDGTRISTTHHTDTGLKPLNLPKGTYSITCSVENVLVPGYYHLIIGAHDLKTSHGLDFILNAVDFSVFGYSEDRKIEHDIFNSSFTYLKAQWNNVIIYS